MDSRPNTPTNRQERPLYVTPIRPKQRQLSQSQQLSGTVTPSPSRTTFVSSRHKTPMKKRFIHATRWLTDPKSEDEEKTFEPSPNIIRVQKHSPHRKIFAKDRQYKCSSCGERHPSNKCPLNKCTYCEKPGHETNACPLKIKEKKASMEKFPPPRPRGKILTIEEKRLAIRVLYEVTAETAVKNVSTKAAHIRACTYTGLSNRVMQDIHFEWKNSQDFATIQSGRKRIDQKYHWSRNWISDIRTITIDLNQRGVPVTVKKILAQINPRLKEYDLVLSRQTCIRLLHFIGFKYNRVSKAINFEETPEIKEWRRRYLRHRDRVKSTEPEAIELWLDESYCNQFYAGGTSWFREGDFVRRGKRGRRWVIVHCGGADGWIGKPLVFEANSGEADYHKNMNAEIFEEYFAELCSSIIIHYPEARLQKGVYIYMDNAAYHKRVEGLEGGVSKLRKGELIEWMKKCDPTLGEDVFSGKTKKDIYAMYQSERHKFRGKTVVDNIAADFGYKITVVWLPPYHPMLNPIEMGWATTKGHVASVNDGKSFQKVREYIFEGFEKVTPEVWEKMVRHTYENEEELIRKNEIRIIQPIEENEDLVEEEEKLEEELEEELEDLGYEELVGDEDITGELVDELW